MSIIVKSGVPGKVPTASQLDYGQLALNYADQKIYFKNSSNQVVEFGGGNTVNLSGNQTISGTKTFTTTIIGKTAGTDAVPSFSAISTGGMYATMWSRRGAPFFSTVSHTGSSYAPLFAQQYSHNSGWTGIYSMGVLNEGAANAGAFNLLHINDAGTQQYAWTFQGHTGNFTSPGNITAYSDIRLKTELLQISQALDKVKSLTGYTYTRKDTGKRQIGLIAQDVQAVIPEAVEDDGERLSLAYGNLVGLLVEAIKELDNRLQVLERKIDGS